jgi:hypothetical protein
VRGIVDHKQVEELARINGDLGRLGGLLKLWLTNDARTAQFGESTIRGSALTDRGDAGPDDWRHAGRGQTQIRAMRTLAAEIRRSPG